MPEDIAKTATSNLKLERQLCFALHSASGMIDQLYRPLLAAQGLTYAQYVALMALGEKDHVSITALAKRLGVSKATMTPMLRRLEEKTLINRQIQSHNERQKLVTITPTGRALLGNSCHATELVFARTGLSAEQADSLIAMCNLISANANEN